MALWHSVYCMLPLTKEKTKYYYFWTMYLVKQWFKLCLQKRPLFSLTNLLNFYQGLSIWPSCVWIPWFPGWSVGLQAQRGSREHSHRTWCESPAEWIYGRRWVVQLEDHLLTATWIQTFSWEWSSFTCSTLWLCLQRRRGWPGCRSWRPGCGHRCGGRRAWGETSYWVRGFCLMFSGCRSQWCCSAGGAPPSAHRLYTTRSPPIWEGRGGGGVCENFLDHQGSQLSNLLDYKLTWSWKMLWCSLAGRSRLSASSPQLALPLPLLLPPELCSRESIQFNLI